MSEIDSWFKIKEQDEKGDEDCKAVHPYEYVTFNDLVEAIEEIRKSYGDIFEDFEFRFERVGHGFGAETNWYELWGKARDPVKYRILYGHK